MSRRSQAFSSGQPAFSWKLERIPGGRYKATCRNNPDISATGDTEQQAMRAANAAMETAVDCADVGMAGPGMLKNGLN